MVKSQKTAKKVKKKVLFTSHTANFQKFNQALILMLRAKLKKNYKSFNMKGCEVHYASAREEEIKNVDKSFKVDFARNPFKFWAHIRAYYQLKKIIEANHYDLIHTHTPVGSVITRLAARKARKNGCKVIYTCHGFQFFEGGPWLDWILWYPIERLMAHFCDLIITINSEDYHLAKKHFKTKVAMIDGVGVEVEKYQKSFSEKKKAQLRKKLKLKQDDFVISYVAEFIRRKNHRMLIKAACPIIEEHPEVKLLLIGDGKLLPRYQRRIQKAGLTKNIKFLGYRKDIPELLSISDLYVSTSKNEGLGLNVLEALLMDCPVVMTDNRGHSEIASARAKYLVGDNDVDTLEDKIELALRGAISYKLKFPERYSLENSLSKMNKIYKGFLQ